MLQFKLHFYPLLLLFVQSEKTAWWPCSIQFIFCLIAIPKNSNRNFDQKYIYKLWVKHFFACRKIWIH